MIDEWKCSAALEPANTVIRLGRKGVERIAVRIQHIDIAVAVEIDERNPARAEGGLIRRKNIFAAETSAAVVQKRHDGLVLLADKGHEVEPAVAVEVDRGNVNCSMTSVEDAHSECRSGVMDPQVLEQQDPARLSPPELRDHQIQVPVAVEIAWLDVGHPPEPGLQDVRLPAAIGRPSEPDDLALRVIGREVA